MTDRLKGLVVTFENDTREDDAQGIINAIYMVKGVVNVSEVISDPGSQVDRERIKYELLANINKLIRDYR